MAAAHLVHRGLGRDPGARRRPRRRMSHTVSGRFSQSLRRAWSGASRSSMCSVSLPLQSRQPMPALRQPAAAQSWVSCGENALCRSNTGQISGLPGSRAPLARGIGDHRLELLAQRLRRVLQVDRVAVGLRHLAAVGAGHALRLGEQRLRLREDGPIEVVEAAHDLARQLDVRRLVLAHRHGVGLVDDDVGRLQQRIAEEAVGREILVRDLLPAAPCRSARARARAAA